MPIFRKDGRNILFVHVPKCGGASIENAFKASGYNALYLDGRGRGPSTVNHLRRCTPQHMHAELLQQLFRIERFDLVFMLVRDPIDRFRSEYLWQNRKADAPAVGARDVSAWATHAFKAYRTNPFLYDNHMRPQCQFWLPAALVYHMEDGLERATADLNDRFDLGISVMKERANRVKPRNGVSSTDVEVEPGLERRLKSFYAADFDLFAYGVDVTPRRNGERLSPARAPWAASDCGHRASRTRRLISRITP